MPIEFFVAAFITLFVVADPVGSAAVFSALTQRMNSFHSRQVAIKAVMTALALYAFFGFFGMKLLSYMHISLDAFKVAGGLLLFVTAFRMIMGSHDQAALQSDENNVYTDHSHLAVFPLAIPLLAGPGCLTTLLLLLSASKSAMHELAICLAVVLVQLVALAMFLMADKVKKLIGPGLMIMIARVMGILLASMAVQFITDAGKNLLAGV